MSVQAITWALKQRTGSPSAKAILLALANYAGPDGDCYPSQERLAEDTEQSVDSVQRRLRDLEVAGFIFRQHRQSKKGHRRSDEFTILLDDESRARAASMGWAPDVGLEARTTSARPRHVEANAAECGEGNGVKPTPQDAPSNTANEALPKPQLCGTEPKHEPSLGTTPYPQQGEGEEFELRWLAFFTAWGFTDPTDLPAPAKRLFGRLPIAEQNAASAGAQRYKTHCRINDRKAKHAASWLRDRGWEAGARNVVEPNAALVWIERGTPEAAAWHRHKVEVEGLRGLFMQEQIRPDGARAVGRYMPSKWPPRQPVAASSPQIPLPEATSQ